MKQMQHTLRKAAILIASLDDATAEKLLTQMGPAEAGRVRRAIEELEDVDPREQNDVVEEFRRVGPLVPEKSPPGLEIESSLARKLSQSQAAHLAEQAAASQRSDAPPFRFLHEAQADSILPVLEREHPQTIAVVVSHLPAPRAADVISRLPAALQGEVIRRLGDLDETDPEILREVEQGFEKWVSEQMRGHRRRAAGLETIAAILEAADDATRQMILTNLAGQERTAPRQIQAARVPESASPALRVVSAEPQPQRPESVAQVMGFAAVHPATDFHDFTRRKDAVLVAVFRAAGMDLSALALAGATPQFVERVAGRLSRREARTLRKALANLGPTRLRDVEQAKQELANLALGFDDKGRRMAAKPVLSAVA